MDDSNATNAAAYVRSCAVTGSGTRLPMPVATNTTAETPLQTTSRTVPKKNITADVIADLLVDFCSDHGDALTNLKLQRLLYYCQAWHLALYDEPLFSDHIEAWVHGPVQPKVYARFSRFGHQIIEQPKSGWRVLKRIGKHIQDVMAAYGRFSSYDLERIACDEEPWRDARRGLAHDDLSVRVIDQAAMQHYYTKKLHGQERSKED